MRCVRDGQVDDVDAGRLRASGAFGNLEPRRAEVGIVIRMLVICLSVVG